jgi:hypothetical protein
LREAGDAGKRLPDFWGNLKDLHGRSLRNGEAPNYWGASAEAREEPQRGGVESKQTFLAMPELPAIRKEAVLLAR